MFRQDLPLRGFDEDLRKTIHENLEQRGITVHHNCSPLEITREEDGTLITRTSIGNVQSDAVMFATGRRPNTSRPDLGLEDVGVDLDDAGAVVVDDFSRTTVSNIWAVGDVTNRVNLTPVALMEGMAFVRSVIDRTLTKPNYANLSLIHI